MPNPFGGYKEPEVTLEDPEDNEPQVTLPEKKPNNEPKVTSKVVPQEVLQQFLNESGYPTDLKVKIVDLVQGNNRAGIGSYAIDFIPGQRIRVENGRFVK